MLLPGTVQEKGRQVHRCKLSWKELQKWHVLGREKQQKKAWEQNGCVGLVGALGVIYLTRSTLTRV